MPSGMRESSKAVDGLAAEAVVAGNGVGDEGLDARVADVLELLVVGRVHVGFMGVEAGGAPTDLPDLVEVGVAGFEFGALLEGVGGEVGREGFEGEWVGAGGDVEIEIAPGAPPEGLKTRWSPPSGRKLSVRPRALRSSTASRSPLCSFLS